MKTLFASAILALGTALAMQTAHAGAVDELLSSYRSQGAVEFSAERGKEMWAKPVRHPRSGKEQRCASCHTADLRQTGKHAKTGKLIDPMAPSVNPKRLTDVKFIKKWFLRNCKGTWGRECTAQEKGDFLLFIQNQ